MKIIYHYRGQIERGNGGPGYDWHSGYSEQSPEGFTTFPWMTRKECQADAKAKGAVADFAEPRHRAGFQLVKTTDTSPL